MVRSEVAISWLLDLGFWVFFPLGTTINLSGLFAYRETFGIELEEHGKGF